MSDTKQPTDTSTDGATKEGGKELDGDQLENVAGGLLPAVSFESIKGLPLGPGAVKIEIESFKVIGEDGLAPARKK